MFVPTALDELDRETKTKVADDSFQRWLKNCLSAIMVLGQNRQVIKRPELNKLIYIGDRAQFHRVTKLVMHSAAHHLNKYMGMRLFELEDSKGYLLVNSSPELNQYRQEYTQEECFENSMIFFALMEIFTSSDESSSEEQIREVVKCLDLDDDEFKKHFDFLQKKLYIVPIKENGYQQDETLYKWGPRAIAEIEPDKFMETFLDLAEETEAKDWPEQQRRIELIKAARNG